MWNGPGPVGLDILDTLCSGLPHQSYLVKEVMDDTGRSSLCVFHALKRLRARKLVGRRKSQAKGLGQHRAYRWYATDTGKQLIARNRALMVSEVGP